MSLAIVSQMNNFPMSPARLFVYVWSTWILLALWAPFLEYPFSKSPPAIILMWTCNILFLAPFLLLARYIPAATYSFCNDVALPLRRVHAELRALRLMRLLCYVLGIMSLIMRIASKFQAAGLGAGFNPIAIRAALLEQGASSTGLDVVAAVSYPFCLFFFAFNQLYVDKGGKTNPALALSLFILITFDSVLVGGTTGLALNYAYIWFSSRQAYQRVSLKLIALCVTLLLAAGYLFYLRVESMYDGISLYLTLMDGAWLVRLKSSIYDLTSTEGAIGYLSFVAFYIAYYFTHGVYEFYYLADKFDITNFTYGQLQFGVILKLLNFFGLDYENYADLQSRINIITGHYQTFWGNAYMDFGYGAAIEALILGIISFIFYLKRIQGKISGVISYPLIQSLIIYSIFSNGLSGERFYIVAMIPVVCLLYPSLVKAFEYKLWRGNVS